MEADDLLCSRNARPSKEEREAARPSFLLAERARSECARPTRAVKDSLATPLGREGVVLQVGQEEQEEALPLVNGASKCHWVGR